MRCCLNPKVIGGLIVAALTVWWIAPGSSSAALPLLVGLICPISMGVMMWQMRRQGNSTCATTSGRSTVGVGSDIDAELSALREELAIVRARRQLRTNEDPPPA
jgi:hypothetical protein